MNSLEGKLLKEGIGLDDRARSRLERFIELLEEWKGVHNLTGARSREEVEANILDSLIPVTFLSAPGRLLDVGTGAGFPGLILAIAWPSSETVLCEPRNKRAAFLRLCALELGLEGVRVEKRRVEELEDRPFDLITSRAVGEAELLMDLTRHLSDEKSRYLLWKGSRLEEELPRLEARGYRPRVLERPPRRYLLIEPHTNA